MQAFVGRYVDALDQAVDQSFCQDGILPDTTGPFSDTEHAGVRCGSPHRARTACFSPASLIRSLSLGEFKEQPRRLPLHAPCEFPEQYKEEIRTAAA